MLNCRHVLLVILTVKKLLERFTKKICKKNKKIKNSLELKKLSREIGLWKEWKGYDNCFSS